MSATQPGWLRRSARGLWRIVDGTRRVTLNLLFVAIVVALIVGWLTSGAPRLQDKTVLVLDLAGPLVEQRSGNRRELALQQVQGETSAQVPLRDLLAALDGAARDDKVASVLLMLDDFAGAGLPNLREATLAIERFKKASGKKVVAWARHYRQGPYYVAAAADEVYLHPMGTLRLEGYGRLRTYYLDAFERLGVKANVVRVGKYKNFGEPYFTNAPSKETMEADASLYDALWAAYTGAVERARKLPAGHLMRGIDALPERLAAAGGSLARMALSEKLVDGLKTDDELRAMLIERGALDDASKSFRQIRLADYVKRLPVRRDGPAVGVVVAEGEIGDGDAPPGAIGGRSTAALVRKARENVDIKALVLRVRSPGGSAYASEQIRRELELTRAAGKPVVVSMGDVAASGGYWISMAADEVIADPSTVTGSIGVFAMLPTGEGLMGKLSLHTGGYGTTWLTQAYDPRRGLDERFAGVMQSAIRNIYDEFIGKAAAARKSTPEKIDAVGQGRVWTGQQALKLGLVDRTGSYGDALAAARRLAKLGDDARVAYVERDASTLDRALRWLGTSTLAELAATVMEHAVADRLPRAVEPSTAAADALWPGWRSEFLWLAELIERRQPFDAVAHCLCTPP